VTDDGCHWSIAAAAADDDDDDDDDADARPTLAASSLL